MVRTRPTEKKEGHTDKQMMLKRITRWKWKMLAIPRAKHRKMQSTPVLKKAKYLMSVNFSAGLTSRITVRDNIASTQLQLNAILAIDMFS